MRRGLPAARDIVADRGYDAKAVLGMIEATAARGHLPTRRDRKHQRPVDREIYRQRNLVERFFDKLKHFRRIKPAGQRLRHIEGLLVRRQADAVRRDHRLAHDDDGGAVGKGDGPFRKPQPLGDELQVQALHHPVHRRFASTATHPRLPSRPPPPALSTEQSLSL